jgi:hypothetical protein
VARCLLLAVRWGISKTLSSPVTTQAEATVLQNMKFRVIRDVQAFESYSNAGSEGVGVTEREFDEIVDDCRDALAEAYHALSDAIGGTTQQVVEKVQKAEAVMASSGMYAPVIGKTAQFISSPQQYMVGAAHLFVAFCG